MNDWLAVVITTGQQLSWLCFGWSRSSPKQRTKLKKSKTEQGHFLEVSQVRLALRSFWTSSVAWVPLTGDDRKIIETNQRSLVTPESASFTYVVNGMFTHSHLNSLENQKSKSLSVPPIRFVWHWLVYLITLQPFQSDHCCPLKNVLFVTLTMALQTMNGGLCDPHR